MPLLHVALQEGFGDEPVLATVNGHEQFRKDHVRTRTQIGLADSFELTLPAGPVEIAVTARGATHRITASLSADLYVGVSITRDGQIVDKQSTHAFGYV
jgi:hypothetical protein